MASTASPPSRSTAGKLIVLTGPSGVGKGTLLKALRQKHPDIFVSISATTRAPRPGEVHAQHYYFLSREQFAEWVEQGEFLEWAEYAGNCYGTPRQPVLERVEQGEKVVLEIELEGARQVAKSYPQALRIFVLPPSQEELERRLRLRAQDSEAAIARRLSCSQTELLAAKEFDFQIVNHQLDEALQQLEAAVFEPTPLLSSRR
ncbi:guanylate kinase [Leptolyngbya sp. FACHB-261]|uniref:guanylate kinase n=1 Tax=Leptolyngbya sp. FACHB-261 TaxID=2692806 RepID=UPI0016893FBC|nr:guanylate kinase [Leptolyngbya sp. FACHB-261]MBD2101427.1 guanylate kinase [Leptolyngbya sp. FACHB-261]